MANNTQWLSDVHQEAASTDTDALGYTRASSRFMFFIPSDESDGEMEEDNDGDLVVARKTPLTISIEHTLSTQIEHVGLQIWPGCLLMCDYIIDNRYMFAGKAVLELGGGIGLASMVASAVGASNVVCTDTGDEILSLCQANAEKNSSPMLVRELDWFHPVELQKLASEADFIIASDVVYDNELTEAFFNVLHTAMRQSPKVLFVTLEQRMNFLTDGLRVACPAYEFFIQQLSIFKEQGKKDGILYDVEQLTTSFPQYSDYDRSPFCELWRMTSSPMI